MLDVALRMTIASLVWLALLCTGARALTLNDLIGECPEMQSLCASPPTASPRPTQSPRPTPSPTPRRPSPGPIRCDTGLGVKTLTVGDPVYMCFTVNDSQKGVTVFVDSINLGNASCGSVRMETTTVSGHKVYSTGAQPGTVWFREVGKWSVKVTLEYGCASYKFLAHLDTTDLR